MEEKINISFSCGTLTCTLFGELDHHAERGHRVRIDRAVYEHRPDTLVLDFSHICFADSSALGLVMGRKRLCDEMNIALKLRGVSVELSSMLRITGLGVGLSILQKT